MLPPGLRKLSRMADYKLEELIIKLLFLSVRQECNWKLQILKYIIFNHHYNNTETSSFIYVHKLFCGIRRFINVSRFHKIFPVYYYWLFYFFFLREGPLAEYFSWIFETEYRHRCCQVLRCCLLQYSAVASLQHYYHVQVPTGGWTRFCLVGLHLVNIVTYLTVKRKLLSVDLWLMVI